MHVQGVRPVAQWCAGCKCAGTLDTWELLWGDQWDGGCWGDFGTIEARKGRVVFGINGGRTVGVVGRDVGGAGSCYKRSAA